MVMRYVNALDPQQVAEQLSISRRQYYREHALALEAIAEILRQGGSMVQHQSNRETLFRSEVERMAQNEQRADVIEVVVAVVALLQKLIDENAIEVCLNFPPRLPVVSTARSLLRQVVMGLLGYLVNTVHDATFDFSVTLTHSELILRLKVTSAARLPLWRNGDEWLVSLRDMLTVNETRIELVSLGEDTGLFELTLPVSREHTVLAVDDNADMLALFERYLTPHGYRVLTAQNADTALELVRHTQPFALLLDLMMPNQDGWELLQALVTQAATRFVPVIVCSVLKQKDLALALGAFGYIEKPITEQVLIDTLEELRRVVENEL
jgi:CheY-like chemotaxis protein